MENNSKHDSETWHGAIHPTQALRQYREKTGIAAKLVVVGMVSSGLCRRPLTEKRWGNGQSRFPSALRYVLEAPRARRGSAPAPL